MKIGNPADTSAATALTPSRAAASDADKTAAAAIAPAAGGVEASAQVALSNTASALRSGVADVSGEFDAGKVDRIGQAIANGTFKVNPEVIADKLIANAQELLSKTTR